MKQGILAHLSPFAKLIFLVMLMIACFILSMIAGILLAIPFYQINLFTDFSPLTDSGNPDSVPVLKFFQILQSIGLFVIPALLAGSFFSGDSTGYSGLKRLTTPSVFLLATVVLFVSLPLGNWLTSLNEAISLPAFLSGMEEWMTETEMNAANITDLFLEVNSFGGLLVNLLMIAMLPAIGEELIFRGLLQRLLGEWFGNIHWAIWVSAFIFGAIHMQFYGIIPRVLMGVLFGYFYAWTGSLWVPVFAHFINNGVAVVVAFMQSAGLTKINYENFGATGNPFFILLSTLMTASLLYFTWLLARRHNIHR